MRQRFYKYILALIAVFSSISIYAYEPMIREDRIWEYWSDENYIHPTWGPAIRHHPIYCKFEGTETVNGIVYHKLLSWHPEKEDSDLRTVALMREENNRVYLLLDQENLYLESPYTTTPTDNHKPLKIVADNNELLLYDFSTERAWEVFFTGRVNYDDCTDMITTIWPIGPHSDGNLSSSELSLVHAYFKDETFSHLNKDWKIRIFGLNQDSLNFFPLYPVHYDLYNGEMIEWIMEGIGNVGSGYLHRPQMNLRPILCSSGSGEDPDYLAYFVRQMDLDGNIIFNAPWVNGSGVEEVAAPGQETDSASYDLSGKRVVNPEPGTIYIQDGKKHIAH